MRRVRHRKGLRRFIIGSVTSALLCASALTVAALYYSDDLIRWVYMRRLYSSNEETRASGLSFIYRHREDPRIAETAKWMLDGADPDSFDKLVDAMGTIGQWGPQFERSWVRYLVERAPRVTPERRRGIAAEFARMIWQRQPAFDDPRIEATVRQMLKDADGGVRLNAVTAAAVMPDRAKAIEMLRPLGTDSEPVVAWHASIMLKLLQGLSTDEGTEPGPPDSALASAKELARLERLPTASQTDVELPDGQAPLSLLQAVRVSKTSKPEDLLPVFEAGQSTIRDYAVWTAIERFTPAECRGLAEQLIGSFDDNQRMAGAMLAGVLPADAVDKKLSEMLTVRQQSPGTWNVLQHYNLALTMRGQKIDKFDTADLLLRPDFPKSTTVMGLLQLGRIEGADWLLNPLGEPPMKGTEGLRQLFDTFRYWPVFHHYFPDAPSLWLWAEPAVQRKQIEVIRDWYLLNRNRLKFDPVKKIFNAEGADRAENAEKK